MTRIPITPSMLGAAEYPNILHTFVLHHTEGTGEQGGRGVKIKEVVGSSDNLSELSEMGHAMYPRPTSWEWDGYTIKINLSTKEGQRLWDINVEENKLHFERLHKDMAEHPDDYITSTVGDNVIYMKKHGAWDDSKPIGSSGQSAVMWMANVDPNTNTLIAPIEFYEPQKDE